MLSTDCILFLRTCRAVFSWGLSHPCGGGVSDCISSVNKAANRGWKRTFLSRGIILTCWEIISHWVFCVQMSTARSPKQPHANPRPLPPVFNLRLDKDKLVLRTNSIITNNPRCSRTKGALMNELFTYLSARSAECEPDPPKCHFIMRPQSGALPLPSVTGDWKSLHVSPNSYQT